jgi:PAS domain S-box-containing protein
MTGKNKNSERAAELRRRALAVAGGNPLTGADDMAALSPADSRKMLHELRVHQIELEMQNEELRRTQVELDVSRARYFDLYDLAPVSYYTVSEATGLLLEANLAGATLLGLARAELINKPITRFIVREDQDSYYRYRQQIAASESPWCDLRMLKHDGTPFWARLRATAAIEADGTAVTRIIVVDISERKQLESDRRLLDRELQERNTELENARRIADKANLAKSNFLSGMSHELRTPLSAILGFAQLIESGKPPLTPGQTRNIDQILKAGWYLLELINQILDLALIESGKLSLSVEPVSLSEIMLECQSMIEPQAQSRGISVAFPRFEVTRFIKADRIRVKQVLINLLSNAIKYNRKQGTVRVACSIPSPERIRISVRDSGTGLSPEQMAQLFQPFNRLGQEAGTEQGTGIGLVVCQQLVTLMGGLIGVESTVGEGSEFWIELDLSGDAELARRAPDSTGCVKAQPAGDAPLRTLLYVEDNPANLLLVEEIIARRPDIRLLSARDGLSGIRLANESQPDVILMDINLPGISGLEALSILVRDPATAHIPVVALSANAMPHDIEKGLQAGFFRYLTKPVRINEFMVALDLALNQTGKTAIESRRQT